ncbi:CGNR zinc finger domain-containing protein [Chengkuizengella axinellae]|uniref:CGNR zinc finger domain-containing protein n=1 Tax=Chengkuizengella axinellae TaxID=3064388 RepID=A0ABT9IX31_9BACL|nr:CGNR zinc finger domain-containing protein [Chengkuizengella sp. 2205SS18-9]MDP5273925.1 CGNR zinc finger domain-containing protein [Chengkuizengella sp. 2205SS18-9]
MGYYNEEWLSLTFEILNSYDPYYENPEKLPGVDELNEVLQKYNLFEKKPTTFDDLAAIQKYRNQLRKLISIGSDEELVAFLTIFESQNPIRSRLSSEGNGNYKIIYGQSLKSNRPLVDAILAVCSFSLGRELVEYGRTRLKSCASTPCEEIFIDRSKNGLQRFCSKKCSTRFHVKKYRKSNK